MLPLQQGRLVKHSELSAKQIVEEALKITADICVYTNANIRVEEIECGS